MRLIILLISINFSILSYGQLTMTETFHSNILGEDRVIRVHLPQSFEKDGSKKYNLILTLDGEYMFYATIGNTELLSSEDNDIIPEVVVVGIDQNFQNENGETSRWVDCDYSWKTGFPEKKGIQFSSFISDELIPYIDRKYHTTNFRTIIGHSLTANYINYFLTNSENQFQGFVAISPYIPSSLEDSLTYRMNNLESPVFYYLSTGENDLVGHKGLILRLDSSSFSKVENSNFHYSFANYSVENHVSLVNRSLPDALKFIYSIYSPIDENELEKILLEELNPIEYVHEKYHRINSLYNHDKLIRLNDFFYLSFVLESQENWEELRKLGEETINLYPESTYGYYMLGTTEEKLGELEKALKHYEFGYEKLTSDISNKEDFYEPIKRIKELMDKKR